MEFEGKTWIPTPDDDRQGTKLELKYSEVRCFFLFRLSNVPLASDSTTNDLQEVTSHLLTDSALNAAFPNLATLASLQLVLPVT